MSILSVGLTPVHAGAATVLHRLPPSGPFRMLTHLGAVGSILVAIVLGFAALALVQGLWLVWLFLRTGSASRPER